ncbi:SdiA-regulated domain-containing protein [uncultured Gelidibacter sp.]|uniref:SdiA-regulated domain-containing protein n=1 Tax=uncultured Gelidibacter sp. TaxID=259318 RepID=UPI00262310B0|nr:SdiA-regulated domain-containing protein [uncultured Gelidibacter sp.]
MKRSAIYVAVFSAVLVGIAIIGFSKVSKANEQMVEASKHYRITETWELPKELEEISGITWLGNNTLACIQDEDGIVYIYNLDQKSIVEEIPFAGNGDYEGIALNGDTLYVMQSDGLLYEIKNWNDANRVVSSHQTGFKSSNNMESLTYSSNDAALLTVPKDKDSQEDYKGVYKISLPIKNLDTDSPAYKIDMNSDVLAPYREKKARKTFFPSEIAIHPKSHDMYILEGKHPKLLIMDSAGTAKSVYKLDEVNFPQPEGMTFNENGDLYISNESVGGAANIHLVELNN